MNHVFLKYLLYFLVVILCAGCFSEAENTDTRSQAADSSIADGARATSTSSENPYSSPEQQAVVTLLEYEYLDPYVYLNEPDVISDNQVLRQKLLQEIQSLSENTGLDSFSPEQRLQLKQSLLEKCYEQDECNYVPEAFKILSNVSGLLNLEYGYNQWMNFDEWFKYAVFDLKDGQRIASKEIFSNPGAVLSMLEQRYLNVFKGYLVTNQRETDEDEHEYQLYLEHLEYRVPFELKALDNLELIYNDDEYLDALYFHYQGQAGNYRQIFPNGYIEFSAKELAGFFTPGFLLRFKN